MGDKVKPLPEPAEVKPQVGEWWWAKRKADATIEIALWSQSSESFLTPMEKINPPVDRCEIPGCKSSVVDTITIRVCEKHKGEM